MLDLEKEVFITLGCGDRFEISKFDNPKNRECFCKPFGGLWSSPENSTWGWRDWCEAENFWIDKINGSSFRFQLKPGSKVYTIDSPFDLIQIPYKIKTPLSCFGSDLIDFEIMAKEYDGILLTVNGQNTTRFSEYEYGMSLYGWDCESLLVLRPDNVIEV